MCRNRIIFCLFLVTIVASKGRSAQQVATYNLTVDEISLTFNASDSHGTPVANLKLDDLHLLDNGQPPRIRHRFACVEEDADTEQAGRARLTPAVAAWPSPTRSISSSSLPNQAFVMKFTFSIRDDAAWTNNSADLAAIPPRTQSTGIHTLADLTAQTGGRNLYPGDSDASILTDLYTINTERRTEYRLIYRPSVLKHDGSFHRIELTTSIAMPRSPTRSGYYAPWR